MIANKDTFIKCSTYTQVHTLYTHSDYSHYTLITLDYSSGIKLTQQNTKSILLPFLIWVSYRHVWDHKWVAANLYDSPSTTPPTTSSIWGYKNQRRKHSGANPTYKTNPQIHQLKRSRESLRYIYIYIFGIWNLELNHVLCLKSRGELSLLLCYNFLKTSLGIVFHQPKMN